MEKELLILAKSIKQGGYCVAGLDIQQAASGHKQLTRQWIRPVTHNPQQGCSGSFSFADGQNFQLFDTVRFAMQGPAAVDGQQENWIWQGTTPIKTGHVDMPAALHQIAADSDAVWFDPRTPEDRILGADFHQHSKRHDSLLLIQPEELVVCLEVKPVFGQDYLKPVITLDFTHQQRRFYGINATDPNLRGVFRGCFPHQPGEKNYYRLEAGDAYWLVLSLTLPFNGRRYLLAAGVIDHTLNGRSIR